MGKELAVVRKKCPVLRDLLDERGRRVWAAAEASSLLRGGVISGGPSYPKATKLLTMADAGGQQRQSVAAVEGRATASGKSQRPAPADIAFSAGNQQVEIRSNTARSPSLHKTGGQDRWSAIEPSFI